MRDGVAGVSGGASTAGPPTPDASVSSNSGSASASLSPGPGAVVSSLISPAIMPQWARKRSASMAAMQPVPAAVTAWR